MVRVLVAEDSRVVREHLSLLLAEDPEIQVVGTAKDGREAVEQARRLRPDVILMDVTMPRMDGYEATREIMTTAARPIVMMSSGFDQGGVATTFAALAAGAVAVLEKPAGGGSSTEIAAAREFCETVRLMAGVRVIRRWKGQPSPASRERPAGAGEQASPRWPAGRKMEIAVIGASTGGPAVLAEILGGQGANLGIPVVVVQHIVRGFADGLATWLGDQTPLRVKLAEAYEELCPGVVYLAPDDRHLGIGPGRHIQLTQGPPEEGFRPSISYAFRSVAARYGSNALGILLTGMGQDGAAGLLEMRREGGLTMVQDAESSVVFGMAARAIGLGAVDAVLSPPEITRRLHLLGHTAGAPQ